MSQDIFGGVEGGASMSTLILVDGNGKCLAQTVGLGTNYWTVTMEESRRRIVELVKDGLKKANLPLDTKIRCLCLSISGAEEKASRMEFRQGFLDVYPNLCDHYVICSDTIGPLATVKAGGGAVMIAGTGSNALIINPDDSIFNCGGWGHLLGDEGSAYWIAHKALKTYFDHVDRLEIVPCGYSTDVLWETIKTFFQIETRHDLLSHFYKNFEKSRIARLCKDLSEKANEGDPLCRWLFEKAGEYLAKHLTSLSYAASKELLEAEGGLAVVCVGSVWKSWNLLKTGFMNQFHRDSGKITEFSLLRLERPAALGAAYMAAEAAKCYFHKDYKINSRVFHHYKKM